MSDAKTKILIVDDDPMVLSVLEETFRDDPTLLVSTLADSTAAFHRVETEKFDLLITDLMMPRVDGLRLLAHAISKQPDILVVMISGYASLETTLQAIHAGVYDYITKPFRVEEFRLLVHNASEHIRLKAENRQLRTENVELNNRLSALEAARETEEREVIRLKIELSRWQDLVGQTGVAGNTATNDNHHRTRLSFYEKGVETSDERFGREFRHLESLFALGRLTPDEFEQARQRLKTLV